MTTPEKIRRKMDPLGKRQAILAAGEALFATNGYQNTSMADIAREAHVAVGTLYRQFPDKLSLLAALHKAMEAGFIDAMAAGWQSSARYPEKFTAMVAAIFDKAEQVLPIMGLYALTSDLVRVDGYVPGQAMITAIKDQYRSGIEAGVLRDLDLDFVAASAHGMVEGAMKAYAYNPSEAARDKAVDIVASAFNRAFVL